MKQLYRFASMILLVLSVLTVKPPAVYAVWPFTFGASMGQVLGSETEPHGFYGAVSGFLKKFAVNSTSGSQSWAPRGATGERPEYMRGPSGATGAMGLLIPEDRLAAALKEGKITEAQLSEIKSRLYAIRTKQQELSALEKSFREWLVSNKIQTSAFAPSGVRGQMPPKEMMRRSSGSSGNTDESSN